MEVELFSYSGMTALLGITIVFLSLVGLCLLMVILKVIVKEREEGDTLKIPIGPEVLPKKTEEESAWVIGAVAAFLMDEEDFSPSAAGWAPDPSEASDPWLNRTIF